MDTIMAGEDKTEAFKEQVKQEWISIDSRFNEIRKLLALETIRDESQRHDFIVNSHSQFVLARSDWVLNKVSKGMKLDYS